MPTVRKVHRAEAESWDLDLAPFVLDSLLDRIAGDDRKGLTRIDRPGAAGGEHEAQRAPPRQSVHRQRRASPPVR